MSNSLQNRFSHFVGPCDQDSRGNNISGLLVTSTCSKHMVAYVSHFCYLIPNYEMLIISRSCALDKKNWVAFYSLVLAMSTDLSYAL